MSWEDRMAQNATTRAARLTAEQVTHYEPHVVDWFRRRREAHAEMVATMTLGEAVQYAAPQDWACACPGPLVCCWQRSDHARQVVRAAHIAVKQVAALRPASS